MLAASSTLLTPSSKFNPSHFVPPTIHPRNTLPLFPKSHFKLALVSRVTSNGPTDGAAVDATTSPEIDTVENESPDHGDGSVGLFVGMLGPDHDPVEREEAIIALWQYSLGGNECIDNIMQFLGCINLVVDLLRSESSSTCEAAAGLLRSLSSVERYRRSVLVSGAIAEMNKLLRQSSLAPKVKEQIVSTLWHLSLDEKVRMDVGKGGILANLASSHGNPSNMVRAGVIPKLEIDQVENESSDLGDDSVSSFVRMLGLDHDPVDREVAIIALWQYSLGGNNCIDKIMQFPGCINLIVSLLRSESSSACEAAAGLLRSLSSVDRYRNSVADSGAIEEINRLLRQSSLAPEVKEQSICTLWNLFVDEKLRMKIGKDDILPLAIKYLDDEDMMVKEAAGGILSKLALSHDNHSIMVEAGVIPKLAKFLTSDSSKESKVIKKEAKNALLELIKDKYHKILVVEEGLVPVPLIGAAAYESYTPPLYEFPTLPDGTEIERTYKKGSKFGAPDLLVGFHMDNDAIRDEAKINAIMGQTRQQFLVRIGVVEMGETTPDSDCPNDQRLTLLPWIDGVARLVLMLELEDKAAISRAAESIANACINEHMRIAFKEAGAIKRLVRLLVSDDNAVKLAVIQALEMLSSSNVICRVIEAEGGLGPLVSILKCSDIAGTLLEKSLNVLAQILGPSKEMQLKFYDGSVNGFEKTFGGAKNDVVSEGLNSTEQAESVNGSEKTFGGAKNDVVSEGLNSSEKAISKTNPRSVILDPLFVERLVEILKSSSPILQEKATSVIEFVALTDPTLTPVTCQDIENGLKSCFQQKNVKIPADTESDVEDQFLETSAIDLEEAGLAISAASRLLTRLLDCEPFRHKINFPHFIGMLRKILKSNIPLHHKDWVAACLVKLSSLSGNNTSSNPVSAEVAVYETIPRLVEQIKTSFSIEAQETAVVELNRIVSEGMVDAAGAIISGEALCPLVKLIEEGSERAVEASLAILYNLSMDSENHSALVSAGAVPALKRIILSQKPQWQRALHLLRNL